jgi:regulatory protein
MSKFCSQKIDACKKAAFRLLTRKSYFTGELREKLILKGHSEEAVEAALEVCRRIGLLDDTAMKERFIARAHKKGYGPKQIAFSLKQRGEKVDVETDQVDAIMTLLSGKYRKYSLSVLKEKQKVFLALQRRGFDSESIHQAFHLKKNSG